MTDHGFPGLGTGPQLAAVVEVTGNLDAAGLCCLTSFPADFHQIGTQCGSDTGEMEPIGTVKDLIPVEISGRGLLDCGMGTVINTDGATLGSALFIEVDTHPVAATDDLGGVHTITAEAVHSGLADRVGGQLGNKCGIHAVVCQGDCYIGFATAEGEFHMVALDKTLIVIRLQTQHQFAESNNSCHIYILPFSINPSLRRGHQCTTA